LRQWRRRATLISLTNYGSLTSQCGKTKAKPGNTMAHEFLNPTAIKPGNI
jgi:hypothetical protein